VKVSFTTVIDKQVCSANEKRCGNAHKKLPFRNSFKLILKQNIENVWERRSYVFPPHYTLLICECMLLFSLIVLLICPWLWTGKWNTELQWIQPLSLPYQFRTYLGYYGK